ncbi:MAG: hypothetical protein ACI9QC_000002 [Oceanicoccus sp.]|jgi:hypothetical protein
MEQASNNHKLPEISDEVKASILAKILNGADPVEIGQAKPDDIDMRLDEWFENICILNDRAKTLRADNTEISTTDFNQKIQDTL